MVDMIGTTDFDNRAPRTNVAVRATCHRPHREPVGLFGGHREVGTVFEDAEAHLTGLTDARRVLEVEDGDLLIGPDEDIAAVDVAQRPSPSMDPVDDIDEARGDRAHPLGVDVGVVLLLTQVGDRPRRKRHAVDVVKLEVAVLPRMEHATQVLDPRNIVQIPQHFLLDTLTRL